MTIGPSITDPAPFFHFFETRKATMTPDEIIDLLRPLLHVTGGLRTGALTEFDAGIAPLVRTHRLLSGTNPFDEILRHDLFDLCDHIDSLAGAMPEPSALATAPRIDRWCGAVVEDLPVLIGVVTSHPRLREGARTMTSPLVRIAPQEGWARTLSRYYRLGRPDQSCLAALLAEGRLPPEAQAFDIPS
ncbi:DUF6634 family protein [Rhodobacter capsulatus]|uniref:DUF6634 family protein n=1 Tax=Rhodobacter capsulatus TaxID=1061 RepID=UPI0030CA30F4